MWYCHMYLQPDWKQSSRNERENFESVRKFLSCPSFLISSTSIPAMNGVTGLISWGSGHTWGHDKCPGRAAKHLAGPVMSLNIPRCPRTSDRGHKLGPGWMLNIISSSSWFAIRGRLADKWIRVDLRVFQSVSRVNQRWDKFYFPRCDAWEDWEWKMLRAPHWAPSLWPDTANMTFEVLIGPLTTS